MATLQDLKDQINQIEAELEDGLTLGDIPLQEDYATNYSDLEVCVYSYLGHVYAKIETETY